MTFDRRGLLKTLIALPVIGGTLAILSPFLRYLKPNGKPYEIPLTAPDVPAGGPQIVGKTTFLEKPFDYFYFTYVQKYPQYDPDRFKEANIAGVAVRLPNKVKFVQPDSGFVGFEGETDIALFQRICPHLGCIFNFIPDWHEVTAGYGGYVPPPSERHSLMACPCHLSIYDPSFPDYPGNKISGPAPRGARFFRFAIKGEDIIVTGAEEGGIAHAPSPAGPRRS